MRILNLTEKTIVAVKAKEAKSFLARLKGLLGKKFFGPEDALVIDGCQAIHMFFMKFSIDVLFIDQKNKVVGLVQNIKPFCISPFFFRARQAIELPAGSIEKSSVHIGDCLEIE
ncbi:MAG: DUF192 domain-containing protein [Candidatus Omnitrophica bacterium]|nr:DUF192 domain-containing protein [Candidatus Omnitrophota bacterium]